MLAMNAYLHHQHNAMQKKVRMRKVIVDKRGIANVSEMLKESTFREPRCSRRFSMNEFVSLVKFDPNTHCSQVFMWNFFFSGIIFSVEYRQFQVFKFNIKGLDCNRGYNTKETHIYSAQRPGYAAVPVGTTLSWLWFSNSRKHIILVPVGTVYVHAREISLNTPYFCNNKTPCTKEHKEFTVICFPQQPVWCEIH